MNENQIFGNKLKELRSAKQLSVRKVAALIGVPPSTYRDWETGKPVTGNPYIKIARVYSISLEELMTGNKPNISAINEEISRIEQILLNLKSALSSLPSS